MMNIKTVRATANNMIEAIRIASEQSVRVMKYLLEREEDKEASREDARKTADRMNEEIDGAVKILCTLYITAVKGDAMKYDAELQEKIKEVNALRVSVWDAIDLIEQEKEMDV